MAARKSKKPDKPKTHPEHWDRLFHDSIKGESDRASVIIAAAVLEQALETMLRSRLVPAATQVDPLFDGAYAPISTFSAKIDLSFRMGLIAAKEAKALHLIRRIRNDFAHNVTGCSFEDATVRSRVLELVNSQRVVEASPEFRKDYPAGPAGDFQITVSWLLWWLWSCAERTKPLQAQPDQLPPPLIQAGPKAKKVAADSSEGESETN